MFFRQIYEEGLAQASYIVGCPDKEVALVVDPRRDVDVYLRIARENDLKIVGVTETHIHADFLSGARELAAATGATLHLSACGGPEWAYKKAAGIDIHPLRDGDVIDVGTVRVRVLHVPGHTPEHLAFVISEDDSSPGPMIAMTGDFVFVGDVGRPDLLESAIGVAGSAQSGARAMFASLRDKFSELPEFVQIWPGHGAGSACGKALGAVPASTAGYERLTAWWAPMMNAGDEAGFIAELLDGQPDAPTYFARMKLLNRDGARILGSLPAAPRLDATALRAALDAGAVVIDTRESSTFKAGHVAGALSVPDEPTFATRSAWFAQPDASIVLVARPERVDALVRSLIRVGLDRIAGFVDATDASATAGLSMESLKSVGIESAQDRWRSGSALVIDVRSSLEYRHGHIPGAMHVPAGKLLGALDRVPRDRPLMVHCAGGGRSAAAASALMSRGYENVEDVTGGFDAWEAAGNPVETGLTTKAESVPR
jgi:hydroxyacylglutathione hydrolase